MFHRLHKNAVAYSATTMAAVLMNSVFQFYYVNLFLNRYRISAYWFNFAQVLYMVWNAINDPLFGYFQDYSKMECLKHRRLNILYGAPLFAISFLLPWFAWTEDSSQEWLVGLHLLVALSFYDSMFTYVLLAQCSLSAEISLDDADRQRILKYSQVASICGASAVIFTEVASNHMENFGRFQIVCVIIACVSWWLMHYSGTNVKVAVDRSSVSVDKSSDADETCYDIIKISLQIFSNGNFVSFVITNFCQVLHSTYAANFFAIFRDHLIGANGLPLYVSSIMAGSAFILPQITILLLGPAISKYGYHSIISASFYIKIFMGVFLYSFGSGSKPLLALFMVLDSTFVNACFGIFNLPIAHIIDEDKENFNRRHPISSMVFGTNALVTKPANSIAPMFIVYILQQHGYKSDSLQVNSSLATLEASKELKDTMFMLLYAIPILLGAVQMVVWRFYRLKGRSKSPMPVIQTL